MAKVYILSYLAHEETPYGMDFLTNSAPFATREAAEEEAQGIHESCADMEDSVEGALSWKNLPREKVGKVRNAWMADDGQHMFLIREFRIDTGA